MTSTALKSAVIQGIRAFVAGFIVVYPASNVIGAASGSQPLDVGALRAAAVAGLFALAMFIWRGFIDPIPVPTLADKTGGAPPA